jgi:hypothetical protein
LVDVGSTVVTGESGQMGTVVVDGDELLVELVTVDWSASVRIRPGGEGAVAADTGELVHLGSFSVVAGAWNIERMAACLALLLGFVSLWFFALCCWRRQGVW